MKMCFKTLGLPPPPTREVPLEVPIAMRLVI